MAQATHVDTGSHGVKRQAVRINEQSLLASADSLKSKGLPVPLCDLISNMIDCANGGDESYCKLSDVLEDLQLMIDTPATFLRGIDMAKLATSGLQLNERIFGRKDKLAALQDSYRRAAFSYERVCGLISGMSGTGKSVLARCLGSFITQSGGLFLQGKFDQTQATPFSALAAAFGQFCSIMIEEGGTPRANRVASELKSILGNEVYFLGKVIPNLCQFLGLELIEYGEVQGCVDPQKRIVYLICQFVDVISRFSEVPVTLFIDDVQWADDESIGIFFQLLLRLGPSNGKRQFYFLACMRQDELAVDGQENEMSNPFYRMLSRAVLFGVSVTRVNLACLDECTINTMISGLLCLSPRLTRPLSNVIYHKTKGNPLFVSHLIVSLNKEGLLRISLSRRRWEWDEEKISARQLPDDVVEFLVRTIRRQPVDVQSSLRVLSCFGVQTRHDILRALETKLDLSLIEPLEVAVVEGLLKKVDECYIFSHDKIQEAAYQMIKPEDRCLYHFQNGVSLVPYALDMKNDDALCVAANQINLGGAGHVKDEEQGLLIANLNLHAGQKSMGKSDYSSAHSYFDHGISFLPKNHWRGHYHISLELFQLAAECAFAMGDMQMLALLTQQIIEFGRSPEDKLNSHYFLVRALDTSYKLQQAADKGVMVLSQLGEDIPVDATEYDAKSHMQEVNTLLCNVTDEQLLNYKAMTDSTKIMVMKFLAHLYISMYVMLRPLSMHVATLKMVKLCLCHGMCSVSPMAFTCYGGLLAALGNIREGYRFVKVAFNMLDQSESCEMAGLVIGFGTHIRCYVEPLHATIELFIDGCNASMKSGDTSTAVLHKLFHTIGLFWSSRENLEMVKKGFADCRQSMKQYNQLTLLTNLSIVETSALTLLGLEDKIEKTVDFAGNKVFAKSYHFQSLYVGYLFDRYDQMILSAKEYFKLKNMRPFLLHTDADQTFILGLAAFRIYRESKDYVWFECGCSSKVELKQWTKASEWNFKGKLHLLEAEEHFSFGDFESASASYDDAITSSKTHKFLNDEAIACELAGYCFLEQGKKEISLRYFLRAHEKYDEWGGCAKANALFEFVQEKFDGGEKCTIPAE